MSYQLNNQPRSGGSSKTTDRGDFSTSSQESNRFNQQMCLNASLTTPSCLEMTYPMTRQSYRLGASTIALDAARTYRLMGRTNTMIGIMPRILKLRKCKLPGFPKHRNYQTGRLHRIPARNLAADEANRKRDKLGSVLDEVLQTYPCHYR